jgi:hypothetical protein
MASEVLQQPIPNAYQVTFHWVAASGDTSLSPILICPLSKLHFSLSENGQQYNGIIYYRYRFSQALRAITIRSNNDPNEPKGIIIRSNTDSYGPRAITTRYKN